MFKSRSLMNFEPQRILILQLRQVGDALLSTPAIRALRKTFPAARIDILVEPAPAAVLSGNPHLDEIILRHPKRGWTESLVTINAVRRNRYDLVIDFLANPRTTVISLFSGANTTLSFAGKRRSRFYKYTVEPRGNYSAEQKLSMLEVLGVEDGDLRPVFAVSEKARAAADKWLAENNLEKSRYIIIDSTHRRITRLWKRFGELADLIYKEHNLPCVFLWGPGEEEYVDSILAGCEADHIKGPRPSFDMTGAILEHAAAHIGTCSAPAHIAAALGIPSLQVIGSSRPENWVLPEPIHRTILLDLPCQPCGSNECESGDIECMEALTPEAVLDEFRKLAHEAVPELHKLLEGKG